MASIPQLYPEYVSPVDYSELLASVMASTENDVAGTTTSSCTTLPSSSGAMWGEENYGYPMYDNGVHNIVPPESDKVSMSSVPVMNFLEGFGMVDLANMLAISDISDNNGFQGIMNQKNCEEYQKDVSEVGQESCKFMPENTTAGENWRILHNVPTMEESNIKVGRYSAEERKDRIMRYLDKRNRRNFNKTIKYACRKTLADRRVRVRGRFARNNELCEEDNPMKKNTSPSNKADPFYGNAAQIRMDEEDCWLQEMMGNPLYLPYISG